MSQSKRSGEATDSQYPPALDAEIVKAIHWCRLGRVRPDDDSAFVKAKELGLLAQDSVWRATERGEGVLIALGLLRGEPAPRRTSQVVLWAVSERYRTPQLVRLWSVWQDESGTLAAELDEVKEDFESYGDGGPWRYFTTRAWLDIPTIPEPEDDDDY